MIKIDRTMLDQASAAARSSPRRRMNRNFHETSEEPLQRMLNAIEPLSYIRPHFHEEPEKREIFFVLRGRLAVVEFDDQGHITDHFLLSPEAGNYGVEIPHRVYHTIIALDPGTVAYEIKVGPFVPLNDKNFAPWSPEAETPGVKDYLSGLLRGIPNL
jgi:cupin fold WbuC family metalloprotein